MALQIWMPLNGNLDNQGLLNMTAINNGATVNTSGKIGSCYSFDGSDDYIVLGNIGSYFDGSAFTICFWIKSLEDGTRGVIFSSYNLPSTSEFFSLEINAGGVTNNSLRFDWRGYDIFYSGQGTIPYNEWAHIAVTYNGADTILTYKNGELLYTKTYTLPAITTGNTYYLGRDSRTGSTALNGYLNDFRLYDHALSKDEIKQISKGLVLHYPLSRSGQDNLFIGTGMTATDRSGLVTNSSTDWTKYFRIYNGSTSIHTFSDSDGVVEDTIKLNSASNLGICFVRKATDISLDSTQYYTLSCEAKTTKSGASLAIGLSYYNSSNSWVWRGGTNTKAFSATNTWQTFTLTFKPDADTQYICYCFTVVGVASGTDTWTIRKCKLEEGSIATPWIPNSADALYSTIKLNDNTEYDISGYQNNGIKNDPNLIYSSDTVRFDASTMNLQGQDSDVYPLKGNIALNDIDTITISMWAKPSANGKQGSGFLCTSANSVPTDYQATVMNQYDNKIACTNTSGTVVNLTVSNQFTLNEWHHYAFVYDGTKAYFYKDGTLVTSATQTGKLKPITAIFPFYSKAGGLSRVSSGKMSDLRVYATALSADDILKLYHGIE